MEWKHSKVNHSFYLPRCHWCIGNPRSIKEDWLLCNMSQCSSDNKVQRLKQSIDVTLFRMSRITKDREFIWVHNIKNYKIQL